MSFQEFNRALAIWNYTPVMRPMPVPGISSLLEGELVCVTFSKALVPYLIGLLEIYRWSDKFSGSDEEKATAIKVFHDLIVALTEGNCMRLRQNPANPCQLQQSWDGGTTWSLAFDYSLCRSQSSDPYVTRYVTSQQWQDWRNTTNLTQINQYAPVTTWVSAPGDTPQLTIARDQALCIACQDFGVMALAAVKAVKEQNAADQGAILTAVLGVLAALTAAGVIVASAGTATPVILAIGAAIAPALFNVIGAIDTAQLTNANGKKIGCCLYDYLKDKSVSLSEFQAAAAAVCPDVPPGVHDVVSLLLNNDAERARDQYHSFISLLGSYVGAGLVSALPDCLCDEWCYTFDFTQNDGGWSLIPGAEFGEYSGGAWRSTSGIESALYGNRGTYIQRTFTQTMVTEITFEFAFTSGLLGSGQAANAITVVVNTSDGFIRRDNPPSGFQTITLSGARLINSVQFIARTGIAPSGEMFDPGGECVVSKVIMRGTGDNPFGQSNC